MRIINADNLVVDARLGENETPYVSKAQIDDEPTVEAIPIGLYEQVKGERDVAIKQLKSLNIELFEKPYLEAIPIEWVKRWAMKSENTYNREQIVEMLNDWEKENGDSKV